MPCKFRLTLATAAIEDDYFLIFNFSLFKKKKKKRYYLSCKKTQNLGGFSFFWGAVGQMNGIYDDCGTSVYVRVCIKLSFSMRGKTRTLLRELWNPMPITLLIDGRACTVCVCARRSPCGVTKAQRRVFKVENDTALICLAFQPPPRFSIDGERSLFVCFPRHLLCVSRSNCAVSISFHDFFCRRGLRHLHQNRIDAF